MKLEKAEAERVIFPGLELSIDMLAPAVSLFALNPVPFPIKSVPSAIEERGSPVPPLEVGRGA